MDVVAYNPLITHIVKYLQTVPTTRFCATQTNVSAGCGTRQDLPNLAVLGTFLLMVFPVDIIFADGVDIGLLADG
jgi:hypothetical protein